MNENKGPCYLCGKEANIVGDYPRYIKIDCSNSECLPYYSITRDVIYFYFENNRLTSKDKKNLRQYLRRKYGQPEEYIRITKPEILRGIREIVNEDELRGLKKT